MAVPHLSIIALRQNCHGVCACLRGSLTPCSHPLPFDASWQSIFLPAPLVAAVASPPSFHLLFLFVKH
jgi:hypothetical protein